MTKCWQPLTFATIGFLIGLIYKEFESQFQVFAAQPVSDPSSYISSTKTDLVDVVSDVMQLGFPSYDTVRVRKSYVLGYDRRNKIPNWVCENLTPDLIRHNPNVTRRKTEYFEDESIHPYFRATLADYRGSGYDRGHLAPSGDHKRSQEMMNDTFVLSNMAPQVGVGFNQDAWNDLEIHVRRLVPKYKSVFVCSGPLFLPRRMNATRTKEGRKFVTYEVIGENNVAVPTHFYKILACETDGNLFDMEAYIMPNQYIAKSKPLTDFMVSQEAIERAAGLLFFNQLKKSDFRTINGKTS
ncbi:endonuclease G, mitochondrial-like [Uloborus diversus]|uniref:endonuclease G, mitochondrial-like n=1 Tax=Uloborus diversus TaxID=327109 RepID=UPI0024090E8B|nr:endonuclease G, mitochondrial-like [Uloborus diversus]XP_054707751.1 endonuclease G, mitochondrial-like [Uloborus diversus]XP_054707752.1 endonuclease G, mitochondrial-like [Uloborus diversus]